MGGGNAKDIKKIILIIGVTLVFLFILALGNSIVKIPWGAPTLTCEVNGEKFKAIKNEHMWSNTGNSNLGMMIEEAEEKLEGHQISGGSTLKLKLSSDKELKDFTARQYVVDNNGVQSIIEVPLSDYSVTVAEKPGEYIYSFIAGWDDTHWVEYLAKIVIQD